MCMDSERVYTLHEAAERLHMPYRTLRDAVYAGRWPHRFISQRRRLMTEMDIQEVLEIARMDARPIPTRAEVSSTRSSVRALLGAS